MSAPARRPVVPKLGSSFLTRQMSLQSPTPPIQPQTQQHRKQTFRRQSSEDLSLRRGRRRGRDTPPATPSEENIKPRDSSTTSGAEKRAHTADNSDVRWRNERQNPDPSLPVPSGMFNRHFPQSKEAASTPGSGPVGGRPITPGRSRPVRVAWAEKKGTGLPVQQQGEPPVDLGTEEDLPVEVVARRVGQPKPMTGSVIKAKLARSHESLPCISGDKDSIFQTRQQLAEKLRRAWWGEDQLRPNLDIFLSCALKESLDRTSSTEGGSKEERDEGERKDVKEDSNGKVISIKIDTSLTDSKASSTESAEGVGNSEPYSGDDGGNQNSVKSPTPDASSPRSLPLPEVPSKGGNTSTKTCPSNELRVSSPSHAAGNEFNRGVDVEVKPKDVLPTGNPSKANDRPVDGQPQQLTSEQRTPNAQPSASLTSSTSNVQADGTAPANQSAVGKSTSETKKETVPTVGKQPTASTNEGKTQGACSASLRRAQFRNSGMNRRTVSRSIDVNEKAPDGAVPSTATSTNAGQTTPSSRLSGALSGSQSNISEGCGKAREDSAKGKKVAQQVQEVFAGERKRNAESAGITRASTIDMGESSTACGFEGGSVPPTPPRPSTAIRPSDRTTLRSSASFVTAATARHRQKTSKRRVLRRATEDDVGAEGEGGLEEAPKGEAGPRGKGGVRGALADVVTMVSLVSPTGSDTEDPLPEVFSFPRDPAITPPAVPTPVAVSSRGDGGRRGGALLSRMLSVDALPERTSQRKLHKSVSFQTDSPPEEDCFSRRPAFPASLLIPRMSSASNLTSSANPPEVSSAQPPAVAPPPHVPKIINPTAARAAYSPPTLNTNVAEKQSGSSAASKVAAPKEEDANKLNKKRVMFRTRSSSLRGSLEHTEGRDNSVESGEKSSLAKVQSGNNGDGAADGSANGTIATANSSKQRAMVVVLPERRHSITTRSEEKSRSLKSGQSLGGPRPSTAIGSKGSNIVDKGKKEEANAEAEEEDEEVKRPQFKTAKERECWELYQRMCEKGLSVSYDTILRGMLTPTEYRMRRNALLSTC